MHSMIGQGLVLVAVLVATFGVVVGFVGGRRQSLRLTRWTEYAAYAFAITMVLANLVMIRALLSHDFSVKYVAQVGSLATPTWVTIVSLWSSLEGSILFWGAIMGGYVAAFTFFNRDAYREYMAYALATILFVAAFFALLIAGPANPFTLLTPAPTNGPGPNPLLQNHILMVIHPPSLYLGYVGMTVPFGIAVAALLRGRLSEGWLKPLRRWTMIPWTFLSIGIVLGGWWAYEVLGWGGYWAWDPVENASLLPWLAATGYLHSTVVQERRRILKAWTLSLVLGSFLLTILGTFMTRSGVFNSVHSFTQSPIGPVFLSFLALVTIGSIGLLVGRAHLLESEGRIEAVLSRESAFLLNNLVFVVLTFTVLLGTVFPLVTEALQGKQVSVGEPYFNRMAVPLGLLMVFMMGVGPVLPWGKPSLRAVGQSFTIPGSAFVVTVIAAVIFGLREPLTIATFGLCSFALAVTFREMLAPARERAERRGTSVAAALPGSIAGNRRRFGGYVVHLAVIAIVAAVAASQTYKITAEASLQPGESFNVGPYTLTYESAGEHYEGPMGSTKEAPPRGANWRRVVNAHIAVSRDGKPLGIVAPALNFYGNQREPIGTPDVFTIGQRDLYTSLLSVTGDGGRVGIRAFSIPLVVWIWYAIPVMAAGSLIALWPKRRTRDLVAPSGASVSAT